MQKDAEEERVMHSKSKNEVFMIYDNPNDNVGKVTSFKISKESRKINERK